MFEAWRTPGTPSEQIIFNLEIMNKEVNETRVLLKDCSASAFEVLGGFREGLSALSRPLITVQGGDEQTSCL